MNKVKQKVPVLRFPEFVNNGEWEDTILDKVADYENGKAHEQEISKNGKYKVVNSKFISTDGTVVKYTNSANLKANIGDVLMVLSDIPNGKAIAKCFYVDKDETYTVNQRICKITPLDIDNKFLFYLQNRNKYFLAFDDGVKQTNLRKDTVLSFPFLKPKTPKEQQKIANCFTSLDDLITAETEKLDHLIDHKKGLLQQLFPANGATKPQFRFPEFINGGEWEEKKLSNLIINITPPKKLKSNQFQEKGKYPIIDQSQNEIAGWADDEHAIIKNNFPIIVFGDHTCALKIIKQPFIQGADGIKILKGNSIVDTRYLYYALQSNPLLMKEYKRHYSILKEKMVSYPNIESNEQQKIANCLSSADALIDEQKIKIKALKKHKKGLMQQLFPNVNELAV